MSLEDKIGDCCLPTQLGSTFLVIAKKKKYTKQKSTKIFSKENYVPTIQKHLSETDLNRKKSLTNSPPYVGLAFSKKKQINRRRKLYEFFVAPITTFWTWALSYALFLCVFIYVLLVKTPLEPSALEWYLLAYVGSCGLELLRRLLISSPKKLKEKLANFFNNFWNTLSMLAVIGFLIGFGFRLMPDIVIQEARPYGSKSFYNLDIKKDVGRLILSVDYVLWALKQLDYLSVHPKLGPYITTSGKMLLNIVYVLIILIVAMITFGVPRQSIMYPNEEWHYLLLRNIFYKPYLMVYGELDAGEIDLCDDDAWYGHLNNGTPLSNYSASDPINCTPGYWLQPFMMSLFLVVASILLLTILIATFNAIFLEAQDISNQIWLFQRYNQVIQYEWTPCIPPPFTPIYYIYMLFKYVKYRQGYWWRPNSDKTKKKHERNIGSHEIEHRHTLFELSLKLYLSQEQIEKLHDFEEECMDQLSRAKETTKLLSTDERIKRTCERTEAVYTKLDGLNEREISVLKSQLENQAQNSNDRQIEIVNYLQEISVTLERLIQGKLDVRPESKLEIHPEEEETDLKVSEIKSPCEIKGTSSTIIGGRYERKFSLQPDSSKFYTRQLSKNWAGYTSITDAIIVQDIELGLTPGGISRTISMNEATSSKEPIKREDSMDLLESDENIDANSKIEEEISTNDQVFESDGDIDNFSIDNK